MNKTALVVGGAGYIGSHTVKALLKQDYRVVVLDNLSKGHREAVPSSVPFIQGDIGDEALLADVFATYPIDVVMHFAAFIEVGTSVREPASYYDNNFVKVVRLLNAMAKAGVHRFVFSSTAATFGNPLCTECTEEGCTEGNPLCTPRTEGNPQTDKISETHPQLPINPYGTTKLMVEWYLRDLSVAHPEFHFAILRYFNACGSSPEGDIGHSYDPPTHLLSLIMKTASGKRPLLSVFGTDYPTPDGTCVRDYIHVSDLAEAHILAMERMFRENISDHYNLGNGAGFSVKEMIKEAKAITGVNFKVEEAPRREGDPAYLIADPAKAKGLLGWQPKIGLRQMIETAWHWERKARY